MKLSARVELLLFLSILFVSVTASVNYTGCLANFTSYVNSTITATYAGNFSGATDAFGNDVSDNITAIVGLKYETCTSLCGTGQEAFDWSVFSQQFSAWLLPWLALVSQLPFGAESRIDNLISVALTVGSPTLAAFSLAMTALNTRWANDRFSAIQYPNRLYAAKALIYLQQFPLRLTTRDGLLASLIVLPQNDDWWECLVDRLEQTYIWTIAAATSVVWVIIAFIFTLVDSFHNISKDVNSNGQGVGTLWLWLVPIIVGWLWIPVCSYEKLKGAIDKANEIAYVATTENNPQIDDPHDPPTIERATNITHRQGLRMYRKKQVFTQDAARTAPVFNYARIWEWHSAVEMVAQAFENADRMAKRHAPVDFRSEWVFTEDKRVPLHRDNRIGSLEQVQVYCGFPARGDEEPDPLVPSGVWKRIFVASILALGLQWSTTSSAAIIVIFTPTVGLGCRSGAYILYGIVSTVIWLTLLLSSYLAHLAKVHHDRGDSSRSRLNSANLAGGLATFLRRLSTSAAVGNTLCIILACLFQFADFYSTCYCDSSVLSLGAEKAYLILGPPEDSQVDVMRGAWIGAVILASGYAILFLLALHLILELSNDTIKD